MNPFHLARRDLLLSLPALALARAGLAQPAATLKVRAISHMVLAVTDPARSTDFYQSLFGMPVQARQGATTVLRVGAGPRFMALSPLRPGQTPGISHYGLAIDDFDPDRVMQVLQSHGVARAAPGSDLTGAPLTAHLRLRDPAMGGARGGTPEIFVGDPDGNVFQLQAPAYAGGTGRQGEITILEPSPKPGVIAIEDYSHFTLFGADPQRANAWYRELFGIGYRSFQGPTMPTLALGRDPQFVMIVGGGAPGRAGAAPPQPQTPAPRPVRIDHACFTMKSFNVEQVQSRLESLGIRPRETTAGPVPPLRHYVSLRMENRGGAREGTPELYFTDPDGIAIQIQDVGYCGGGGYLGNVCPPIV